MVGRKINQGGYPVPGLPGPEGPPGPPGPPGSIGNDSIITKLSFNISQYQLFATGELGWDSNKQALTYGLADGAGKIAIGQTEFAYVNNNSGVTIQRGKMVEAVGTNGADISVELAPIPYVANWGTANVIGMALETISHTGSGYVLVRGLIENIDTSMFLPAVKLYHAASGQGGITANPLASATAFSTIGVVVRSHATLGAIYIDQRTNIAAAQLVGFRNKLDNGGFDVWQRGTSFAAPTNSYTADRWFAWGANTGITYSRGSPPYSINAVYYMRLEATSGTNTISLLQALEYAEVRKLLGETITISFYAFTLAADVTINLGCLKNQAENVANSNLWVTIGTATQCTITTTPAKFSWTGVFPSGGGYVGLAAHIFGSDIPTSTNIYIYNVQLELGSIATPFEFRPYSVELAACQRYYQANTRNVNINLVYGTVYRTNIIFPIVMRVVPTTINISGYTGGGTQVPTEWVGSDGFSTGVNAPTAQPYITGWNASAEL